MFERTNNIDAYQMVNGKQTKFGIYFHLFDLVFCCPGFVSCDVCGSDHCCVIVHCAGVSSVYFARIDMIVGGTTAPSTPRHKRYLSTVKDSPRPAPRPGLDSLHLSSPTNCPQFF